MRSSILRCTPGSTCGSTAVTGSVSSTRRITAALAFVALAAACGDLARAASIPGWQPTFGGKPGPGLQYNVRAMTMFDDGGGDGPLLYSGGTTPPPWGNSVIEVERFDGTRWTPVGKQMLGEIHALGAFDPGTGPELIVGGDIKPLSGGTQFSNVGCFDGSTWSSLGSGTNGPVHALCSFDDGTGPALYAAGSFTSAGGAPANRVARWDGNAWTPLGTGFDDGEVLALVVHDDGGGPALYAGGEFTSSGGAPIAYVARWNGTTWSTLGAGVDRPVHALLSFDDGTGPALYVGGEFLNAGGTPAALIARWDGTQWSAVGPGLVYGSVPVRALAAYDDGSGSGPVLIAGGFFWGLLSGIAVWDGAVWSKLPDSPSQVRAFAVEDAGSGAARLHVGGDFSVAGPVVTNYAATWDGSVWSPIGSGVSGGVRALTTFDDGTGAGARLYVGGGFASAAGVALNRVGAWDGANWSPLGSGINSGTVFALEVYDDGGGAALYAAGGIFGVAGGVGAKNIARWDGAAWSPLGSGVNDQVRALCVYDDGGGSGPALYAAGFFTEAGGNPAKYIARWDGNAWSPLGTGLSYVAHDLAVYDDGSGPALYVAGRFSFAGGVPAFAVARWNGSAWSDLPGGSLDSYAYALQVFDDGSGGGPALYVGGGFDVAGGTWVSRIARWNAQGWSALGFGLSDHVFALAVFDDGSGGGPQLFAGGRFTHEYAGYTPTPYVARWDGSAFTAVGNGLAAYSTSASSPVSTMLAHDPGGGAGASLYVGGDFEAAVDSSDHALARYGRSEPCGTFTPYGASCAGSGGYAPKLALSGCYAPGGALTLRIGAALGGSAALLLVGLNESNSPIGGGCSLLVSPVLAAIGPLPLFGAGAGQGSVQLTAFLPATFGQADAILTAACADPASPIGFTTTNGVRITGPN